jgi:preprotein translocase subunit SecY
MNKQLTNRIFFVLVCLFAFRVLAYITVPGIDTDILKSFFEANKSNTFGIINMFSGGAVERFSIISLGIMPYITASIVMELIAATFPAIGKLKKERDGMVKYVQIIRYVTIFITLLQATGVAIGIQSLTGSNPIMIEMSKFVPIAVISMLAGTMLLLWLGDQITKHGVGQGVSIIIFAGIVSGIPNAIIGTISLVNTGEMNLLKVIAILILILAVVGTIIFVEMGERRIPISYSRKVVMQNQNKRIMNYIPVKINLSGVIPPIFASAVLTLPSTILQALQTTENSILTALNDFLGPNGYFFHILMFLLVVFFAYFYSSITFNAKDISENLKKQGGFIPGVRPGASTAEFLNETASRLTFFGAIYLAIIATIPWALVQLLGVSFYFGGTSVLIVVQVALDTMRRIEAQIYMSKYETLSAVGL